MTKNNRVWYKQVVSGILKGFFYGLIMVFLFILCKDPYNLFGVIFIFMVLFGIPMLYDWAEDN